MFYSARSCFTVHRHLVSGINPCWPLRIPKRRRNSVIRRVCLTGWVRFPLGFPAVTFETDHPLQPLFWDTIRVFLLFYMMLFSMWC